MSAGLGVNSGFGGQASTGLAEHREYLESKLSALRRFTGQLDTVIAWVMESKTRINISKDLSEPDRSRVIENIMVRHHGKTALTLSIFADAVLPKPGFC